MINSIKAAYRRYIELGYNSRNSVPANIMHDAIKSNIEGLFMPGDGFIVRTNNHGGEFQFVSDIHEKKIDITVIEQTTNLPVVAVSFKMPLSSVNKNLRNYFEMNIGDATLVKDGGTPFFFFMVLDKHSMKFNKGIYEHDSISNTSICPFSKVMKAKQYASYRPNHMFITKVDFGDRPFKDAHVGASKTAILADVADQLAQIDAATATAQIYKSTATWTNDFNESFQNLLKSIKLEIELFKIRRNQ